MVQIGESAKENSNGDTGSNYTISSNKVVLGTARVGQKLKQYCIIVVYTFSI